LAVPPDKSLPDLPASASSICRKRGILKGVCALRQKLYVRPEVSRARFRFEWPVHAGKYERNPPEGPVDPEIRP
jgi:hypothetical protein